MSTPEEVMGLVRSYHDQPNALRRHEVDAARAELSPHDAEVVSTYLAGWLDARSQGRWVARPHGKPRAWVRPEDAPELPAGVETTHDPHVHPRAWGRGWAVWSDGSMTRGVTLPATWLSPMLLPDEIREELDWAGLHFGLMDEETREYMRALVGARAARFVDLTSFVGQGWVRVALVGGRGEESVWWRLSTADLDGGLYRASRQPWGQLETWLASRERLLAGTEDPEDQMVVDGLYDLEQERRRRDVLPELLGRERAEDLIERATDIVLDLNDEHLGAQGQIGDLLTPQAPDWLRDPERIRVFVVSEPTFVLGLYYVRGRWLMATSHVPYTRPGVRAGQAPQGHDGGWFVLDLTDQLGAT